MSSTRNIKFAVLNVKISPHPEGSYSDMFKSAVKGEVEAVYNGNDRLVILEYREIKEFPTVFRGKFFKYTGIKNWTIRQTGDTVEVSVPKGANANGEYFEFLFFERDHRLIYECKDRDLSLSPEWTARSLVKLFKQTDYARGLETINVETRKESEAIEAIRAIPKLNFLLMKISKPNEDDADELVDIMDEMDEMGVSEIREELRANLDGDIHLNERYNAHLEATLTDGYAKAIGEDPAEGRIEVETKRHPYIRTKKYDQKGELGRIDFLRGAMLQIAKDLETRI